MNDVDYDAVVIGLQRVRVFALRLSLHCYACDIVNDSRIPLPFFQIGVSWYYSFQDPGAGAKSPQFVTGSAVAPNQAYGDSSRTPLSTADFVRSLVNGGRPIGVLLMAKLLRQPNPSGMLPQFGTEKCTAGDHAGRWMAVSDNKPCIQASCLSNSRLRSAAPSQQEPRASNLNKQWVWVPYDCVYHTYTDADVKACAAQQKMPWFHVTGDEQSSGLSKRLFNLVAPSGVNQTLISNVLYSEVCAFKYSASVAFCD